MNHPRACPRNNQPRRAGRATYFLRLALCVCAIEYPARCVATMKEGKTTWKKTGRNIGGFRSMI